MRITTWLLCLLCACLGAAKTVDDSTSIKVPPSTIGVLYPRESETRELQSLDGFWRFLKSKRGAPYQGIRDKWFLRKLDKAGRTRAMPVPASYNDITMDAMLRDHVGTVWYERNFFVPAGWASGQRTWLRFGSVHYKAIVFINGKEAMTHLIGHLPFEADISSLLKFGEENRVTVVCDNQLTELTVPQGHVEKFVQTQAHDYFNYAGIHRSVYLYTTPLIYIRDITLQTNLTEEGVGHVDYEVNMGNGSVACVHPGYLVLQLLDKEGNVVVEEKPSNPTFCKFTGKLVVPEVKPWWPYLMHPEPGYLYKLEIKLYATGDKLLDVYRLKVGIRSLRWNSKSLLINGKPVYLRGFGMHEDSAIRGRGMDLALLTHDFNLIKWMGANAYRTSNYPYSEESMQLADEHGIMVIDECSSIKTDGFNPNLMQNHMTALEQLIHRDQNHASVIAWSLASKPLAYQNAHNPHKPQEYFEKLTDYVRTIAMGRPITLASEMPVDDDVTARFVDIIGFNRYYAWNTKTANISVIYDGVYEDAYKWNFIYKKPVIMFEYGADSIEGYHTLPTTIWSEEYHKKLISKHFETFDKLRSLKWFIGEFVWNFADYKTTPMIWGMGGDKKGLFTRNRQPKAAAHLLRKRYHALALQLGNISLPADFHHYIVD